MDSLELQLVRAWARYAEHLAGRHNQKSHGNKYGSADAIRGNVARLGGDKAALKSMAKRARKDKDFQAGVKATAQAKRDARKPNGFASKVLPEEVFNNLPTSGRLKEISDQALAKIEKMEAERANSKSRDKNKTSDLLIQVHRNFTGKVNRLNAESKLNGLDDGQKRELEIAQQRLKEVGDEIKFRRDWHNQARQLSAIAESNKTGKLAIERGEKAKILGSRGDVYTDNGVKSDNGRYPYNPDLFITSDISGKKIRNYIKLPDGRVAHPDELTLSGSRKNVIIVDEFSPIKRDWTQS